MCNNLIVCISECKSVCSCDACVTAIQVCAEASMCICLKWKSTDDETALARLYAHKSSVNGWAKRANCCNDGLSSDRLRSNGKECALSFPPDARLAQSAHGALPANQNKRPNKNSAPAARSPSPIYIDNLNNLLATHPIAWCLSSERDKEAAHHFRI